MSLLIKNAAIITQNRDKEILRCGSLEISKNKIIKIFKTPENKNKKYQKIIDARGLIVLPGFINTHVHLGETVYKGLVSVKKDSVQDYINATEEIVRKNKFIEKQRLAVCNYTVLELMRAGTTTICGGRTLESSEKLKIRNVSGYMIMASQKLKRYFVDVEKQSDEYFKKTAKSKFTHPAIFVHSLNMVDGNQIATIKRLLQKHLSVIFMLHLAETEKLEKDVIKKYDCSSVQYLNKNGLLTKKTILIHGNWVTKKDIELIKKGGASLAHCLSSNLKVADKIINLDYYKNNGINVCIATDGMVTGSTFGLLDEARWCGRYHGLAAAKSSELIDMITVNPAKALGLADQVGSLEPGKLADLVFIKPGVAGQKNIFKSVLSSKSSVYGLMINGQLRLWNRRFFKLNEKKIKNKFNSLVKRIKLCQ